MASTRSSQESPSAKVPQKNSTPNKQKQGNASQANEKKRASEASPTQPAKRGRKNEKEQKTIEETMGGTEEESKDEKTDGDAPSKDDEKMEDAANGIEKDEDVEKQINGDKESTNGNKDAKTDPNAQKDGEKNAFDEVKSDTKDVKRAAQEEQDDKASKVNENNESIVEDSAREAAIPSSILEKGIIYFMLRPRVRINDPKSADDVARSHIILRPIPLGAKLGDGPLEDLGNSRLIAVPKKVMPSGPNDRFLSFVENTGATIKELREMFQGAEYSTKTTGTSNQPAERPFAEGIYALTTTGRESHLAYHITVPHTIGTLQNEMGLAQKGSFTTSVKNPSASGPSYAQLDDPAKYPAELQEKFAGRRWCPLEPAHLDCVHTQVLLIGGDMEVAYEKAVEGEDGDEGENGESAGKVEMEKLEEEDHERVEGLRLEEGDPVFADLGLSAKEFAKIQSDW